MRVFPERARTAAEARGYEGFTLIELLITLAILSVGLLGLANLQIQMTRGNTFSRDMLIAQTVAADLVEETKIAATADLRLGRYTFSPGTDYSQAAPYGDRNEDGVLDTGDVDLDGDGTADLLYGGRFRWLRQVTPVPGIPNRFQVTVTVLWPDPAAPKNPHRLVLQDIVPRQG